MIDVNALLDNLRREPEAFAAVWEDEMQEHGRGALAFLPGTVGEERPDGVECEYWTLAEIRARLRDLGQEDEFVLRWLLECDARHGLPVIIVAPDQQAGFFNLCFHRLQRPALLD